MKKLLVPVLSGLIIISLTACRHPSKEAETITSPAAENTDNISKNVYVDSYGEKIEVTINNTKNTAIIHLNGKTFDLKKSDDLPEYTASNEEYQYSDIKGNITFLKKNADMVLFHLKQVKKQSGRTKMASY